MSTQPCRRPLPPPPLTVLPGSPLLDPPLPPLPLCWLAPFFFSLLRRVLPLKLSSDGEEVVEAEVDEDMVDEEERRILLMVTLMKSTTSSNSFRGGSSMVSETH